METALPKFYTIGPYPEIDLGFTTLPTYYTMISLVYCLCIFWFYKRCEDRNLSLDKAMNIGLIVLLGGFLGSRLFHILFEQPRHYLHSPIEVFYFWQGGFVFYGGFIIAYASAFLYIRKQKLTFWLWHDTFAPVAALGYALGRVACFLVGCCYGKVCSLPWAVSVEQVHIASENVTHLWRHPTPLYATAMELLILAFLLWYEKRRPAVGRVFLIWVILHSCARILMETYRADPRGVEWMGLSLSTMISILLIAAASTALGRRKTL